jgi:NAD(P)-dependent dehydrogenase (short-subunit alcohol dehydrogenase family)
VDLIISLFFCSGIGLAAAGFLVRLNPLHRIVLACRSQERADETREKVAALLPEGEGYRENVIALACDHTSMESIRRFNELLRIRLTETYSPSKWIYNGIDVLCLNAAVLVDGDADPEFTEDDLETTFQTNYLSAFQLVHLTMDLLNPGARILLATSGLYEREKLLLDGMVDPVTGGARKHFDMPDGSTFHFKRSYALSKLCAVAFCAELESRLRKQNEKGIIVNCFSPGLMLSTGLFRRQRETKLSAGVLALQKTVTWGAGALLYMALAQESGERSGEYWRDANSVLGWRSIYGQNFCPVDITNQFDAETRRMLWEMSLRWIGLPDTLT